MQYEMMNKPLSLELFKQIYIKANGTFLFQEYFVNEINKRKHLIARDTFRGYMATIGKVKAFKPNLLLSDVDYRFLCEFENYMLKPISEKGRGNIPSTVSKTMKMLRALIMIAVKK